MGRGVGPPRQKKKKKKKKKNDHVAQVTHLGDKSGIHHSFSIQAGYPTRFRVRNRRPVFVGHTQNAMPTYVTGTRTSNIHDKAQAHDPQKTRGNPSPKNSTIRLKGYVDRHQDGQKDVQTTTEVTLQNGPTVKLVTGNQIPHNKLNFNQQEFRHLPVKFNKRKRDGEKNNIKNKKQFLPPQTTYCPEEVNNQPNTSQPLKKKKTRSTVLSKFRNIRNKFHSINPIKYYPTIGAMAETGWYVCFLVIMIESTYASNKEF